jgi:antitoxin component YwqK of YwqJK toxin-antitoxin module
MKHRSLVLSLPLTLLIVFLGSCGNKKTTVVESTYPDQTPKVVKTYKGKGEDKELIAQKTFYPGNKVQMEGTFKDNKRDGRWIYYHSNGKPWSEGFFRNGKANGKRITYYENGNILYEGYYKDDKRVGKWRFFDENGKLVRTVDFSKTSDTTAVSEK